MFGQGSKVLEILREEEKKTRLRFWYILMRMSGHGDVPCPFTDEPPQGAVLFGPMPKYMRSAFMQAYRLRTEERRGEASVFEEAIGDLLQEHYRKTLKARKENGSQPIGQFRLGKNWIVYAVPLG